MERFRKQMEDTDLSIKTLMAGQAMFATDI